MAHATPHDDLRLRYDDGTWDRARLAQKHILFPEQRPAYDTMEVLLGFAP